MSKINENSHAPFIRETADQVLKLFPDLAGALQEFTLLDQGQANEAASLVANDRTYIFKMLPQGIDRQRQEYSANLQMVLTEAGFPCPRLVLNLEHRGLTEYAGRIYSLQTWLPGEHLPPEQRENPAAETSRRLGELLGNLHSLLAEASLPDAPSSAESSARHQFSRVGISAESLFAGKLWRPSLFWKLRLRPGKTSFDKSVLQLLPRLRLVTKHLQQWFSSGHEMLQPMSPTHGDINWENLLFENGTPVALLDFDNAKVQPLLCELAAAVAVFCPDSGSAQEEFLDGYGSTGQQIPDSETLRHLMLLKYCRSLTWQIPAWYNQNKQQPEIRDWIIFLGKKMTDMWDEILLEGKDQ